MAVLKTADKTCKVTWFKNSTVIRESSEISTSFDGTNARLTITKCSKSYSAVYRVVIKNEFGEDESTGELLVTEEEKVRIFTKINNHVFFGKVYNFFLIFSINRRKKKRKKLRRKKLLKKRR